VGFSANNVTDDTNRVALENIVSGQAKTNTTMNTYRNGFAIAQMLECYSTRNDTISNKANTIGQNVFINALLSGTALSTAFTMNIFAYFDCILVIDQGVTKCIF